LAIGSHPDDIEFGIAGTLCRFAQQKHSVYVLVMTSGSGGGDAETRKSEQMNSAKIMGVKDVFWGGFEDTKLPMYLNVIQEIEKIVARVRPAFVFVHHGKDTHQDHRHVSASTVAATRNVPNVLFYEGPTSFDFDPDVFVNINRVMEKKIRTLTCHKSQVMKTNIGNRSIIDIAAATATFRGTQCRVAYAEGFKSLRMFLL
jgi:LmbE family N-acetylglucosaminyl deacetylase